MDATESVTHVENAAASPTTGTQWVVQDREGNLVTAILRAATDQVLLEDEETHGEMTPATKKGSVLWRCVDEEGDELLAIPLVEYVEPDTAEEEEGANPEGEQEDAGEPSKRAHTGPADESGPRNDGTIIGEPSKNGQNHSTAVTARAAETDVCEDFTRRTRQATRQEAEALEEARQEAEATEANRAILILEETFGGFKEWRRHAEPELRRMMPAATESELREEILVAWRAEDESVKTQVKTLAKGSRRPRTVIVLRSPEDTPGFQMWKKANRERILFKRHYALQYSEANLYRHWRAERQEVRDAYQYAAREVDQVKWVCAADVAEAERQSKDTGKNNSAVVHTGGSLSGVVAAGRVGAIKVPPGRVGVTKGKNDLEILKDGLQRLGKMASKAASCNTRAVEAIVTAQSASVLSGAELSKMEETIGELKTSLAWSRIRVLEQTSSGTPAARKVEFDSLKQSLARTEIKAARNHIAMDYWKTKLAATGADIEAANEELATLIGKTAPNADEP